MQSLAEKRGVTLYVGDLGESQAAANTEPAAPDTKPLDVTSRIIAHVGHRIPGIKRVEKRFEGQDKSAGIFSDFAALAANMYEKNEELINGAIVDVLSGQGITLPIALKPQETSSPQDRVIDFGAVSPVVVYNDHERSAEDA